MGLFSLSKRVEALGGKCGMKDRQRDGQSVQGTCVWFTFPFLSVLKSAHTIAGTDEPISAAVTPVTQDKKLPILNLLVVEDSLVIQKSVLRVLKSFGHTVELAENGLVALERMKENGYDVVLMDLNMPIMDGYTAVQEMRNYEAANGILFENRQRILAMSADDNKVVRKKISDCKMDGFMPKPLSLLDFNNNMALLSCQ